MERIPCENCLTLMMCRHHYQTFNDHGIPIAKRCPLVKNYIGYSGEYPHAENLIVSDDEFRARIKIVERTLGHNENSM